LTVFATVRRERPDLSLVLVGTKSLPKELNSQAEVLGLQSGHEVHFLLNLTEELNDLYDSAELFISLSWRETFCLPALEAMARGLPVIASAWGATPEIVSDAGRFVDPRDLESAAHAILDLLDSPNRAHLAKRARENSRRFDWALAAE